MPVSKVIYDGNTLIDLTNDTVTEESLLKGITAHRADGTIIEGTFEGGSATDEIDRILSYGLTDGYKYVMDDGTIESVSDVSGLRLVKTFSNDMKTCTTILYDDGNSELGRTTKTFSDDFSTITTIDRTGRKLVKVFDNQLKTCETVLTDSNSMLLANQTKVFSEDGSSIESNVEYGQNNP